jgi:hypothetical protein
LLATPIVTAAQARTLDLTCVGSTQFNFTPPLRSASTDVSFMGLVSSCLSPNGRYGRLKSGVVFGTKGTTASGCSPAPLRISGGGNNIIWNDGSTTTFSLSVNTTPLGAGFGFAGSLTDGILSGASVTGVPLLVAQRGLCSLSGVRSLSLTGTITFFHR